MLTPSVLAASAALDPAIAVTSADPQSYLIGVYIIYASISVALTVWLARTLFKNGQVFLDDVFAGKPGMAEAVNRLLVIGFYLVNLGYAALLLRADPASSVVGAIETLAFKLGLLLLSLAVMHFANLLVFHRIRRRINEPRHDPAPYRQAAWELPAAHHSAFELIRREQEREALAAAARSGPPIEPT